MADKQKRAARCSDVQQVVEKIMAKEFSRASGRELGQAAITIEKSIVPVCSDRIRRDRTSICERTRCGPTSIRKAELFGRRGAVSGPPGNVARI